MPGSRYRPDERVVIGAMALVAAIVHGAVSDPRYLFCDDLNLFVAFQRYTYQHPWDAFLGVPSPSFLFGSQIHDPDFPSAVPIVPAVLAWIAPSEPYALARFEWHLTSACVAIAVASVYALARRFDVPRALASATAILYPFFGTVGRDYHIAFWLRGKLLLPLAIVLTVRAVKTLRRRDATAFAIAWILALGQSAMAFWVVVAGAVVIGLLAIRERRAITVALKERRHEMLPLVVAGFAIGGTLVPPLLRFGRAMANAAWTHELATNGVLQLEYLLAGGLPLAQVVPTHLLTGMNPVASAGLTLFVALLGRRLARRGPPVPIPTAAWIALAAFAVAVPLLLLQRLPNAFQAEGDHILIHGLRMPRILTSLGHVPERTWLVQMELAGTFAAALTLAAWARTEMPARVRVLDAAIAVALHVIALGALVVELGDIGRSAAIVAIVLACAALATHRFAGVALPALALAFVIPRWHAMLDANADRVAKAEASVVAQVRAAARLPPEIAHRYDFRVGTYGVVRHLPLLLDSGGTMCCGVRVLSMDVVAFLRDAHAVRKEYLPYQIDVDWTHLDEAGLLPLFGIRWWIVDGRAELPFLASPGTPVDGNMVLHEDPRAFPKAWALRTWESAGDRAEATRRVIDLGARRELRDKGVVIGDAGDVLRADVRVVGARPGEVRVATDADGPFVVATNELAGPGWTATIDGATLPVVTVDAVFVGAKIPGGTHDVVLRHRIR